MNQTPQDQDQQSANIYAAPESEPIVATNEFGLPMEVASRWARLGASIVDSLIVGLAAVPIGFLLGFYSALRDPDKPLWSAQELFFSLIGLVIFFAINYVFLFRDGQTVGKKLLKIRIVNLQGVMPDKASIWKRQLFYFGISMVPVVGGILSLINILFIFGSERRCAHDLVASTKVVKALAPIMQES